MAPPQPGLFSVPSSSAHRTKSLHEQPHIRHDDKRKRKDSQQRLPKDYFLERREDIRLAGYHESVTALYGTAIQLSTRPNAHPLFHLRLYPLSIERSALVSQADSAESHAKETIEIAYEEERERIEEEWQKGREKIRERMLEGIEERRRKAREEKDGEGTGADATLDAQTRPHVTRKLRNKLGVSPPLTPSGTNSTPFGTQLPTTIVPLTNPHSLNIDELPSCFPLPLTFSITTPAPASNTITTTTGGGGGRRRAKGGGGQGTVLSGLGKSLSQLTGCKEGEIEGDLGEIRKGHRKRRAVLAARAAA